MRTLTLSLESIHGFDDKHSSVLNPSLSTLWFSWYVILWRCNNTCWFFTPYILQTMCMNTLHHYIHSPNQCNISNYKKWIHKHNSFLIFYVQENSTGYERPFLSFLVTTTMNHFTQTRFSYPFWQRAWITQWIKNASKKLEKKYCILEKKEQLKSDQIISFHLSVSYANFSCCTILAHTAFISSTHCFTLC